MGKQGGADRGAGSYAPRILPAVGIGALVMVLIFVFAVVLASSLASSRDSSSPNQGGRPSIPTSIEPTVPSVPERQVTISWRITPDVLRPDLLGPKFIHTVDGAFSDTYVVPVDPTIADVSVVLTGDKDEKLMVVHGIDPASGRMLWERPMQGTLCANEPDSRGLVCAEILERDRATRLGREWRLHLLDSRTGETRRSRDVAGWFSALHRSGDTLVILEQRISAPHAVLNGYDIATLQPRWDLDLREQPGHDAMFSEKHDRRAQVPFHVGLVIDRPRFRRLWPVL